MKAILPALLCVGLWTCVGGCTNPGLAMREPGSDFESGKMRTADRVKNRQHYVDHNYKMQLETGRAKNEDEARALATLEWEQVRHRSDGGAQQSVTWSSRDAEQQRQKRLASELEQMELE